MYWPRLWSSISNIESTSAPPPEYFLNHTVLAPRNSDVADANEHILNLMSEETSSFLSADKIINEAGADAPFVLIILIPIEVLYSLNSSSLPSGKLHLKIGALIILLCNIDPTNGMCNGTCLIILWMSTHVLKAQIIGGDHNGKVVFILCIHLRQTSKTFNTTFKQFWPFHNECSIPWWPNLIYDVHPFWFLIIWLTKIVPTEIHLKSLVTVLF